MPFLANSGTLTKQLGLALERSTDTYINAKRQNENPDHT